MNRIDYDIYQIKAGERFHGIRFEGTPFLKHTHIPVHPDHYDKVYSSYLPSNQPITGNKAETGEVLESLYEKFNLYNPADFRGHSLSVSDVIVLHENGHSSAHLCDTFGFKEVPEFILPASPSPLLSPPTAIGEQNYLKNAEEYLEENYNNITGTMSVQNKLTPDNDTKPHPEYLQIDSQTTLSDDDAKPTSMKDKSKPATEKTSVLEKLKLAKEDVPFPQKEMDRKKSVRNQELQL